MRSSRGLTKDHARFYPLLHTTRKLSSAIYEHACSIRLDLALQRHDGTYKPSLEKSGHGRRSASLTIITLLMTNFLSPLPLQVCPTSYTPEALNLSTYTIPLRNPQILREAL